MSRTRETRPTSWLGGTAVVVALVLWVLRDLVILVGLALLLAYALDPLASALERIRIAGRGMPRGVASFLVVFAIVLALGTAAVLGIPVLVSELAGFAQRLPATLTRMLEDFRVWASGQGWGPLADQAVAGARTSLEEFSSNLAGTVLRTVGGLVGQLGAVLGAFLIPLLAFYLLAERSGVRASIMRFVPPHERGRFDRLVRAVDPALRSYVRGQVIVCLIVGAMTGVLLGVLGFPYTVLLAVIAAIVEVVPYIGFVVAAAAIAIAGFTESPARALTGVILYVVANNVSSYLVTPRVMGQYLKMHPFVVTVSVLAGAKLLGPGGVLLSLPLAAVIQAAIRSWSGPGGRDGEDPGARDDVEVEDDEAAEAFGRSARGPAMGRRRFRRRRRE